MAQFKISPIGKCASCGKSDGSGFFWLLIDDTGRVIARNFAPLATPAAARDDIEALRAAANTPVVDTTEEDGTAEVPAMDLRDPVDTTGDSE